MTDNSGASSGPAPIPPDDPQRSLVLARPDEDQNLPHIGMVGDTYTILLKDSYTAGRYLLIDMHVPPGGGPPPHRHDVRHGSIKEKRQAVDFARGGSVL